MIALHDECLLLATQDGELVPCSADVLVGEFLAGSEPLIEPQLMQEATAAVLHYFKTELGRPWVTVAEFAQALARVLRTFGLQVVEATEPPAADEVAATDLLELAIASGEAFELAFFPRLRSALRRQLHQSPGFVRFRGLRGCVKRLAGSRRWSQRCERLQRQIIDFLQRSLAHADRRSCCYLLVR